MDAQQIVKYIWSSETCMVAPWKYKTVFIFPLHEVNCSQNVFTIILLAWTQLFRSVALLCRNYYFTISCAQFWKHVYLSVSFLPVCTPFFARAKQIVFGHLFWKSTYGKTISHVLHSKIIFDYLKVSHHWLRSFSFLYW